MNTANNRIHLQEPLNVGFKSLIFPLINTKARKMIPKNKCWNPMNALRGKLNLLRSALSKIEVIVNSINANIIYLFPLAFLKCWKGPSGFSCSPSWSKYVPINKRIKPWICNKPSDSPKTKNAVIATNPGVNTNNVKYLAEAIKSSLEA